MGHLPVQEAKSHVGMRVCTMYVCLCAHTGVHARFGGFPSQAQVLLGLRPLHPPPVPVHALAHPQPHCSHQPQMSVVADVWLCHGNARTGCTSGSQQGQAHTPRLPSLFPSPKTCWEEPLGSRSGTNGVCMGERQSQCPPRGQWQRRGRTHVHIPAESLLVQGAYVCSPLPFGAMLRK